MECGTTDRVCLELWRRIVITLVNKKQTYSVLVLIY
jgi:hypothetical protein